MSLPEPITRKEQYYDGIAKGNASKLPEPITREEQYLEYIAKNGGGGGGGTTDYEALDNKPSVNSVELSGNKTLDDLGIQGKLTFDNEPTEDSQNPVKSGGVYESLESLNNAISSKPDEYADLDDKPSINDVTLSGNKTPSDLGLQPTLDGAQTVEGNPITVTDAESMNAESVKVELEPKQDLHGYDAPWVGGAGKNLLPMTVDGIKSVNTSGTWSGNVYTLNGVTFEILTDSAENVTGIKANGTANADDTNLFLDSFFVLKSGTTYVLNGCTDGSISPPTFFLNVYKVNVGSYLVSENGDSSPYTPSTDLEARGRIFVNNGANVSNQMFYPMLRLSTESDPTFEPYSNICPISGYSEVGVERVGKNLCNVNECNVSSSTFIKSDPVYIGTERVFTVSMKLERIPNVTIDNFYMYPFRVIEYDSEDNWINTIDSNVQYLSSGSVVNFNQTINIGSSTHYIIVALDNNNGDTNVNTHKFNIQLELGNQATTYEPYQGTTYTVSLGGTKYGGILDVTSGELTVTHGSVTESDFTYQGGSSAGGLSWADYDTNNVVSNDSMCSELQTSTNSWGSTTPCYDIIDNVRIRVYGNFTSQQDFEDKYANLQVVYKLATPLTIQLTPTQVQMLETTNNISSDGTNITLKYQPNNVIGECKQYTDEQITKVLPPLPTTDGTYHLSCEVTSGVGVLSWVSDS